MHTDDRDHHRHGAGPGSGPGGQRPPWAGRRAAFDPWDEGFERFGRGPRGRGRGRGGRGRARRGDVRAAVLALLAERPMHGYEIIQELGERTHGLWQPSPGSVYPTLQLLEDEGLVSGEEAEGKRRFTLTGTGREAAAGQRGPAPWDRITRGADPGVMDLRQAMARMFQAAKQVASVGTDDQRARAATILTETRRQLYGILAEDVPADPPGSDAPGSDPDDQAVPPDA